MRTNKTIVDELVRARKAAEALTRARAMASGWVLAKVRERIGSAQ